MPPILLTRAEREVLATLLELKEAPGGMLKRERFSKAWCGASVGRQQADLDRAVAGLIDKGMLRENVNKTMFGFTIAGFDEISN